MAETATQAQDPHVFRYDDPSWAGLFAARDRGEVCEIDEGFYEHFLDVLPPVAMGKTMLMADGKRRLVTFAMAEGAELITGFWAEKMVGEDGSRSRRFFCQRTQHVNKE
jgi:hypothetical protein